MAQADTMTGVLAPVVTPFKADLAVDAERLVRHCRWLAAQGCGLAVFGTNSEANSLTIEEREAVLDRLIEAGLDPARMMPGTGCCAIPDTVRLIRHAVSKGVGGVLVLPPFYYKNVSDEGLYRSYSEVIERVGDSRLRLYLYHFPQMSAVPLSLDLIGRLIRAYPGTVVGIKDSSGDRANLEAILAAFPGFGVFSGTESLLLATMRAGGAGCISATANVNPAPIRELFLHWRSPGAETMQADLAELRGIVQKYPMIAAMKAMIAHYARDGDWNRLRPPLVELPAADADALLAALARHNFEMPGIGG